MILILVLFSVTLIFIVCHFDFPAVCLFFIFRAAGLYAYCTENSLFCRWFPEGGGLPYLALTVIYNVPLSRAWFLGSWTGILYKNVKVGYKHSTFVVWTMFYQNLQFHDVSFKNYLVPCMRNETNQRWGLKASAAKLYPNNPRVLLVSLNRDLLKNCFVNRECMHEVHALCETWTAKILSYLHRTFIEDQSKKLSR